MTDLRDDKPMWGMGEVLRLAAPASLGMMNVTIMQFVDAVMVARLIGPTALAATFVAGILAFVPLSLAAGTCSVVNTFVAQNLGAGRRRRCSRYAWQGLYLAACFAAVLMPLGIFGQHIFRALAAVIVRLGGRPTSPAEVDLQAVYYGILVVGAGLRIMGGVMEQYFYGTHRPGIVYVASVVALVVNVGANYALITGWGPFPQLGLAGAALGTLAGWGAALIVMLATFLGASQHARFRSRVTWRPRLPLVRDILRVGLPAGFQFCNDILSWSVFNVLLVGYFGRVHRVASAAAVRYLFVSFMPAIGVGLACTALVGRHIGAGRPDLARRRTHAALAIAMTYMGLCGLTFLLFRYPLIRLFVRFQDSAELTAAQYAEVVRIGGWVMICAAVFQCFDAVGITFIGALRGAGDTFWPMVFTVALSWGVTVGGGVAAVRFAPQLTSIGPWMAASVYVIILGLTMALRFESGAWRKIDLLGRRAAPAAAPPAGLAEIPPVPGPAAPDVPDSSGRPDPPAPDGNPLTPPGGTI